MTHCTKTRQPCATPWVCCNGEKCRVTQLDQCNSDDSEQHWETPKYTWRDWANEAAKFVAILLCIAAGGIISGFVFQALK